MRRRLLLLCFLVLTWFQLAVAGLPMAAVHTVAATHDTFTAQAVSEQACCGFSAARATTGTAQPTACDPSGCCAVCGSCEVCHQAAISVSHTLLAVVGPLPNAFPRPATSYNSADRFPSLKPTIR